MKNPWPVIFTSVIMAVFMAGPGDGAPQGLSPPPFRPGMRNPVPPPVPVNVPNNASATISVPATAAPSSTVSVPVTPAPSSTLAVMAPVYASTTVLGDSLRQSGASSSTVPVAASSATVFQPAFIEAPITLSSTEPAGPVLKVPTDDELHKRTILVMFPTAYAGHYDGSGLNLNIFMSWFIGTLYNEKGLFIAPIFSLLIGGDAKWSFIEEKQFFPALAVGYLGGLALPFSGGGMSGSGVAKTKQTDIHNAYLVASKKFGPIALSAGGMYGIKRAFPRIIPMLRNSSYTTKTIPRPESLWSVYGGIDASYREQHIKIEVTTFPEERVNRPWLVQTHIDGFLGFDIAYLRDAIGYEVIGYYQIPFYRWPDKGQLEKEREKLAEKLLQQQ